MLTEKHFVSEIAVSYSPTYSQKIKINNITDAVDTFRTMWDVDLMNIQEQFCALFLNQANEVIGFKCLNTGTTSSCILDVKLLFAIACKSLCSGIIIAHNHPSGSTKISGADVKTTKVISKSAKLLGITLIDHLILTQTDAVSLAEKGFIK